MEAVDATLEEFNVNPVAVISVTQKVSFTEGSRVTIYSVVSKEEANVTAIVPAPANVAVPLTSRRKRVRISLKVNSLNSLTNCVILSKVELPGVPPVNCGSIDISTCSLEYLECPLLHNEWKYPLLISGI